MFPFDFLVTWSKVEVKLLVFCDKMLSAQYLLIPLQHSPPCKRLGFGILAAKDAITGSDSSTAECPAISASVMGPLR